MMLFDNSFLNKLIETIGWTVAHSLWQGILALLLFTFLIVLFRHHDIRTKYVISLSILTLFLGAVVITFISIYSNEPIQETQYSSKILNDQLQNDANSQLAYDHPYVFQTANTQNLGETIKNYIQKTKSFINRFVYIITAVWFLGFLFFILRIIKGFWLSNKFKTNRVNQVSLKWQNIINTISQKFGIYRSIKVIFSPIINTPFVFGLFKPIILFPIRAVTHLSDKEIEAILIHELAHILRNDYLVNLFQVLMESLFFYHPAIWWLSAKIRVQREIICDEIAAEYISEKRFYIDTLLKLEEYRYSNSHLVLAAKNDTNKLLYRIKYLLKKKNNKRTIGNPLFAIFIVAFLSIGLILISFKQNSNSTINSNITQTNLNVLSKYFQPFTGSFVLLDVNTGEYNIYNDSLSLVRYTPASTFKIVSSLIALDNGIAPDENYTIKYDSIKYPIAPDLRHAIPFKFWMQDHTLKTALEYSVTWYYQELHRTIGIENIQKYLNQISYGAENNTIDSYDFWFNASLKISAIEQVQFLKKLYNQELSEISGRAQKTAKSIMLNETTPEYKFYGKTGVGDVTDEQIIGWYVGFLETKSDSYVFAMNILANNYKDFANNKRVEITKRIFNELNIISL